MALTYADIDAAVRKKYLPTLVDQVFISNALLVKLMATTQVVFDSGLKIAQPVLYGQLAGGSYKGLDPFDISYKQTQTYAEWDWKNLYVNVTIAGDDMAKTEGDEKIIGLVQSKMETASLTMNELLSKMFFGDGTGNASKDFDGLLNAIDSGSTYSTYGGIDRSTNSWWGSQLDSTGGAITLGAVQNMIGLCTVGTKKPNLAFTTQALFDKLWARVQPQQRFLDGKSDIAKVGFTGINFNNHMEIIVDNHCPSGTMFLLNTEYWKLVLNRSRNFYWTAEKTPTDQDAYVRQLLTMGNLICTQPRVQGVLSGLT
jgi:hypothetical protein